MTNHIAASEWNDYFSRERMTPERLRLIARVHAHIGSCAECRALHERLSECDDALRQLAAMRPAAEPAAFRAVASDAPAAAESESTLAIDIEDGVFLYDTLRLTGDFLRYEFLPAADSPRLTDAYDPDVYMEIIDDQLHLHLPPFPGTELVVDDRRNDRRGQLRIAARAVPAANR